MGLREQAEKDLRSILEDEATGFGWPITITDPQEVSAELTGFSNDIHQMIDPDTGQAISGRVASIALSMKSLADAGLSIPRNIADSGSLPWVIEFDDILGNPYRFKVLEAHPDRAIGLVTCTLETYK